MNKVTHWPHHYAPACKCEQCQAAYRAALLRETEGMLNAYRQGWIEYDKAHVQRLQAERRTLLEAA